LPEAVTRAIKEAMMSKGRGIPTVYLAKGNGKSTGKDTEKSPTPYEIRYRSVYGAGGSRFYPKQPSDAFRNFVDTINTGVGRALIIGCGEGRNIDPLILKNWKVIGIDSAPSALETAAKDYKGNKDVELIEADVLKTLPIPDSSVDLVAVIEFWHLITEPAQRQFVMSEICRVLRPGGIMFFENNGRLGANSVEYLSGGYVEQRTIQTPDGSKQIPLERLPTVMINGGTMRDEVENAGLTIDKMYEDHFQHPDTMREQIIVHAHKP
jgi:SAM-dependent methyltransferase